MTATSYKSRNMGYICHQYRANAVGYLTEPLEIDGPSIGRGARHDELRPALFSDSLDFIIINEAFPVHPIRDAIKVFARKIHR